MGPRGLMRGAGVRRATARRRTQAPLGIPAWVAVLLAVLLLAAAFLAAWLSGLGGRIGAFRTPPPVDIEREKEIRRAHYLRVGWVHDARAVLEAFLAAESVAERALHSLGGEALIPEMTEFHAGRGMDDLDTPAAAFAPVELLLGDRERGLFLMVFDRPPQFALGEFFRPLATLEVQYGVEPPAMLLASFARAANFLQEPLRVQAFFKQTPDGLKIDWHVFVQTKHRLLGRFLFGPSERQTGVFRVLLAEDMPAGGRSDPGTRTYRIEDPIHAEDWIRVVVPVDSEVGRRLTPLNWHGGSSDRNIERTATIELTWRGEDPPRIEISRFLCWEFLGLGGSVDDPAPHAPEHE